MDQIYPTNPIIVAYPSGPRHPDRRWTAHARAPGIKIARPKWLQPKQRKTWVNDDV